MNLKILFTFSLLWLLNGAFSNNLNYKILDGEWEVVFDTLNKSGSHNIEDIKQIFDSIEAVKINVPSCLETYRKDYEGVAIYRKSFFVQEDWRSTNIEIQFEAVNYIAEVWLNNEVVGTHKGGYSPFSFRINETIEIGDTNTLFVRVVTPIILTNQRIDGLGRYEVPSWRGAINGGIWQSVALKSFGKIKIQDVFIKPNYKDHSVVMELEMENTTESKKTVNTVIHFRDSDNHLLKEFDFEITLVPGRNYVSKNTILQNVKNWEPSSPNLYSINISAYHNENLNDQWSHRFGFREFTMENGRFHLNGKEFFLKGTFFEGVYPIQLSWPNDIKIARKEIQLAIDAGFNMIRPWRKPPPKMWLDLCDEMGVLTVGSIAVECMHRPIATPSLPEMVEIEVRESIMRDRNR
ncbi:MAG: sugar-binding domain-containing protein, partial [Bacteroidota bacterium]|nr:sugar-binding domain-containing protein [Bacteroidota bacterium]